MIHKHPLGLVPVPQEIWCKNLFQAACTSIFLAQKSSPCLGAYLAGTREGIFSECQLWEHLHDLEGICQKCGRAEDS